MTRAPLPTPTDLDGFMRSLDRFRSNPPAVDTALLAWVARGVDLDAQVNGQTLLHRALGSSRIWLVEALLRQGADPMSISQNSSAFRAAVCWNETVAVLAMLNTGRVDVHQRDIKGRTILHAAAHNGNVAVIEALMSAGVNGLTPDADGVSALDLYETAHTRHALESHRAEASLRLNVWRLEQSLPPPTSRPRSRM